jgi:excisionase family DNA binding protein
MAEELCTVAFAAERLKLHPKTVLRFIREGRLAGTRMGKSYRILRSDIEALAGAPAPVPVSDQPPWATCIVDVPGVGVEQARKLARQVTTALYSRTGEGPPIRAEVIHEPDRSHLKIILTGPPRDTGAFQSMIQIWLDQPGL